MSNHETAGFKVVDRRQAATENAARTGDATPETPAQTAPQSDAATQSEFTTATPAEATPEVETDIETDIETDVNGAGDLDAEGRGMPDPGMLLSLAAMQLDVQTLARLLVPVFDGQAWRAMGFLADPRTGETQQDLPSAQLAIDCVQFLAGKVETHLSDTERREMQRRLTDLRMNYLGKLREGA